MKSILVVAEDSDRTDNALHVAVDRAEREGASLVVLNVLSQAVYDDRQIAIMRSNAHTREGHTYTMTQATESATRIAEAAGRAAVGDRDVPYLGVGVVGDPVRAVLEVAAEHGCRDVVIQGTTSTVLRRAGRFDRRLAKRFDGTVTRVSGSAPEPQVPPAPPSGGPMVSR